MRKIVNRLISINEDIHEYNFYSLSDDEVDDMRKDPIELLSNTMKFLADPDNADDASIYGKAVCKIAKDMGELFLKSFGEWTKYGKQILKNIEEYERSQNEQNQ